MTFHDDELIRSGLERRLAAVEAFIPEPPLWRAPGDAGDRVPAGVRLGSSLRGYGSTGRRGRRLVLLAATLALLVIVAWTILLAGSRIPQPTDLATGPLGLLRGSDSTASAALLTDGRVLIASGTWQGIGNAVSTARIWDPATGTAGDVAPPLSPRVNPTATLLLDGRVLVVGGFGGPYAYPNTAVATAEVWDPKSEAFTPTGAMAHARVGHTATLLTDGRVLVIGGNGPGNDGTSIEVWDPATGRFTGAGTLDVGRAGHTATLRTDGKVMVIGGIAADGASLGQHGAWDPATSTIDDANGMLLDRPASATVTRLSDGRLLLVGGIRRGGTFPDAVWSFAHLRQPDWRPSENDEITDLGIARFNHAAVLLPDGRVLVLGGMTDDRTSTASVEVFDPATATFTPAAPLPRPIGDPTAILLTDGRVLIIDDRGPGPTLIDVYEPEQR